MSKRVQIIDLVGRVFSRLTVLKFSHTNKHNGAVWECLCSCGVVKVVPARSLVTGHTVSCGCYRRYNLASKTLKHGHSKVGFTSPEYKTWCNMKERCCTEDNKSYKYYGGRGIKICERWINSFENFFEDMGKKPSTAHSIERDDVNGNYEPSNCRWATKKEQAGNTRTNVWLEYEGKKMTITNWAKFFKLKSSSNILFHLRKGKTFEQVYNHFKNKI